MIAAKLSKDWGSPPPRLGSRRVIQKARIRVLGKAGAVQGFSKVHVVDCLGESWSKRADETVLDFRRVMSGGIPDSVEVLQ